MNLHEQIMRLPAFPLHFQLSPQNETYLSICVMMCWDVPLAAGAALGSVASIRSQSKGSV